MTRSARLGNNLAIGLIAVTVIYALVSHWLSPAPPATHPSSPEAVQSHSASPGAGAPQAPQHLPAPRSAPPPPVSPSDGRASPSPAAPPPHAPDAFADLSAARLGVVTQVSDGDTLRVRDAQTTEVLRLRLNGIDAPESDQPAGPEAAAYLSGLVLGQSVAYTEASIDRYGRTVADVYRASDGLFVNQEMVRVGGAWWYREYAPNDSALASLESEACSRCWGLWSLPGPIPPWEWRKGDHGAAPSRAHSPQPGQGDASGLVYVTPTGTKYHRAGCKHLTASAYCLGTASQARVAGYTACNACRPPG